MAKTLDETIVLKMPKALKTKIEKIAQARSERFGMRVTKSDVAREALTQFADTKKQAA